MNSDMKVNLSFVLLLTAGLICASVLHAELTFHHKTDAPLGTVTVNGHTMQAVATDSNTIYANAGDVIKIYRLNRNSHQKYLRWYCLDTDQTAENIVAIDNGSNYNLQDATYGWFKLNAGTTAYELNYTMQDGTYRIAADQSSNTNYDPTTLDSETESFTEPTLTNRLVFDFHPASEMAAMVDTCTGDKFLETYSYTTFTNNPFSIGPKYPYVTNASWCTRCNYYCDTESPAQMSTSANWKWYEDGVEAAYSTTNGRTISVQSEDAGVHTYELKYAYTKYTNTQFATRTNDTLVFTVNQLPMQPYYINQKTTPNTYVGNGKQYSYFIRIADFGLEAGDKIKIVTSIKTDFAFLTSVDDITNGSNPAYCDGTGWKEQGANNEVTYDIPAGCQYVYVIGPLYRNTNKGGGIGWNGTPASITGMKAESTTYNIAKVTVTYKDAIFNHKLDVPMGTISVNGHTMQAVHTQTNVVYANAGETLTNYLPDYKTYQAYVRWYNFDTDSVAANISGSNLFKNKSGWFSYDQGTNERKISYTMQDKVYRIAADQSIYTNWSSKFTGDNGGEGGEPLLSKRLIFEYHPASEIAARIDTCTGESFLETHQMIAPTGRQLYIGPDYPFISIHLKTANGYEYNTHSNYYYTNGEGNVVSMGTGVTTTAEPTHWKWYVDDEQTAIYNSSTGNFNIVSAQFLGASSSTTGKHIYKLKYVTNDTTYNIAKFVVNYMDEAIVGPGTISPSTTNMEKIYEQTFNFDEPGTTNVTYWDGHFAAEESTYGYYYKDYASNRKHQTGDIYWSEYGLVNYHKSWGEGNGVYNHNDTIANLATYKGVKNYTGTLGYLLYCDGSEQPGQVFDLQVHADLCPGAKMYFSAWMADLSGKNNGWCAPNMDFVVMGIDAEGGEHIITTYTTGEWGGYIKSTKGQQWSTWYQVFFPVEFKGDIEYSTYRLKIMNKGRSAQGNDFALDDIRIYVQKPPVYPIQASTYDCPTGAYDSITAYLRVDYQAIDRTNTHFYYQWRDQENNVIDTVYYNDVSHTYGVIEIPATEGEIPAADTCASLLSFDTKYYATSDPVVKYIKESVGDTSRYIMYIAQPLVVRTNYTYTGFVAIRPEDLNGARDGCGTFADLLIAGSTRITINGEAKGDSVVDICGNRSYTLDIELTYIAKNTATGELQLYTTPCRADWLVGDTAWVKEHPDVYGGKTFEQIEAAIMAYREDKNDAAAKPIIDQLVRDQLLHLDTATTLMQPSISLSYTAFPVPGSSANGMSVCLTPHFLHIYPSTEITNMMMIGSSTDNLPAEIKTSPRRVRISNAQKATGEFYLPVYPYGEGVTYVVDTVMLINSTAPSWDTIYLASEPVKHKNDSIIAADSIKISGDLSSLAAGYDYTFHVVFKEEDTGCSRGYTYFTLRIVPDTVTWLGGEWNKDDNWSSFMPLEQTNVILQPKDYNVTFTTAVSDSIYDVNYVRNECNNIYFPDSASLAGQEKLVINGQAFIDLVQPANLWTLTAMPIQGVVSGDIFASQSETDEPFTVAKINQTVGADAVDRTTYQVYQSEYNKSKNKWMNTSNTLMRLITPGEANMIGIDCDDGLANPLIRLPKSDNEYMYYETTTLKWLDYGEGTITRDENYGKPAYTGEAEVTLKEMYDNVYIFGNPTLGYVDLTELVTNNADYLTGRYYMNSAGDSKRPRTITFTDDKNANVAVGEKHILLPPLRGCMLEGKGTASNQLTITVAPEVVNKSGRVPTRRTAVDTDDTNSSNVATDIDNVYEAQDGSVAIYDLAGRLIGNAVDQLTNGIYIIKTGTAVRKVMIK